MSGHIPTTDAPPPAKQTTPITLVMETNEEGLKDLLERLPPHACVHVTLGGQFHEYTVVYENIHLP